MFMMSHALLELATEFILDNKFKSKEAFSCTAVLGVEKLNIVPEEIRKKSKPL